MIRFSLPILLKLNQKTTQILVLPENWVKDDFTADDFRF